jgi:hypothetical protein
MSDTETATAETPMPPLVEMLLTEWSKNSDAVRVADDKLNTDAGATAISRRAVESLDPGVVEQINSTVKNIFHEMTIEQQAGLLYLFRQSMSDYQPTVKKFIEDEQAKVPAQEVPEDEVIALRDERKDGVKAANALRTAVLTAAPKWANEEIGGVDAKGNPLTNLNKYFPELTNLRGSGPRAKSPRLKGSFIWVVDDEPVDGDKVADVSKAIGVSVADFKNALVENFKERGVEFDFADPPKNFAFDLLHGDSEDPEGHAIYKIRATRKDSDPEDEEDDESFTESDESDELFQ